MPVDAQDANSTSSAKSGAFDNHGMTSAEVISLTVISCGIATIGTLSNILLTLSVLLTRQLRETCTAVLLISLSLTDALICAVYEPMYIYDINHDSSAVFEAVRFKLGYCLFLASLNGALNVTLDRFIYICCPYRYIALTSNKYVTMSAFFAQWFIAILLTLLSLVPLYSFLYIAVIMMSLATLHISTYCIARRKDRKIASQYPSVNQRALSIWNKATTVVTLTLVATLLCWTPIVILPAVVPPSSPSFKRYIKTALAFTSLSAAVDPFIFCWRLQEFRNALVACPRKLRSAFHCG